MNYTCLKLCHTVNYNEDIMSGEKERKIYTDLLKDNTATTRKISSALKNWTKAIQIKPPKIEVK